MPKHTKSLDMMPDAVINTLKKLGEDLAIARKRRRESQEEWASRIGVSKPTLIRLEHGDPTVGLGVFATAIWMMDRLKALKEVAEPASDLTALEHDVRKAQNRYKRRSEYDGSL